EDEVRGRRLARLDDAGAVLDLQRRRGGGVVGAPAEVPGRLGERRAGQDGRERQAGKPAQRLCHADLPWRIASRPRRESARSAVGINPPCHCEERSDEAIQGWCTPALDCFLAAARLLAMTRAYAACWNTRAMLALSGSAVSV